MDIQPIPRTTASMNLTAIEELKSQKDNYKTKTLGIINYVRILRDLTNQYLIYQHQLIEPTGRTRRALEKGEKYCPLSKIEEKKKL